MRSRLYLKPKIILSLLLMGILLDGFSIYLFNFLNGIVNNDLYNFGLRYDGEWSTQYWNYYSLILGSIVSAIISLGLASVLVVIYARKESNFLSFISPGFTVLGAGLTAVSMFWYTRLDQVVHSQLYNYGLIFSYDWAMKYWTFAYSILTLQAMMIITTVFSFGLFVLGKRAGKLTSIKVVQSTMLLLGAGALIASVFYNSTILAFIGLGLAFWGGLLVYIRSEEYAQKTLFDQVVMSSLEPLEEIMRELDYQGDAVYLPPQYFRNPEEIRVCILKQKGKKPPSPSRVRAQESQLLIDDPQALLVTPLGGGLLRLFEKNLNVSFTKIDVQFFQQNFQKLLVERLEICGEARMEIQDERIQVFLDSSIFNVIYQLQKQSSTFHRLGTPISSAIACGLAKASGKLVTITKEESSEEGRAISVEYSLQSIQKEE